MLGTQPTFFWAVAAGICCGISDFMIAVLGSVVIFLLMLVLGNIQGNNRYLLIVRGGAAAGEKIEQAVQEVYGGKARLCVKNSARESVEYIYELSQKLLQRTECGHQRKAVSDGQRGDS